MFAACMPVLIPNVMLLHNKYMKLTNKLFFALTVLVLGLAFCSIALAAPANINELTKGVAQSGGLGTNGVNEFTLSQTVGYIIKIVLSLSGMIFLGLTVYAGILWMTASGSDEKVEKAQGIITRAVIGLIITLAAYSIVFFVSSKVFSINTSQGVGGPSTPDATEQCIIRGSQCFDNSVVCDGGGWTADGACNTGFHCCKPS